VHRDRDAHAARIACGSDDDIGPVLAIRDRGQTQRSDIAGDRVGRLEGVDVN
jgi:hypothetical protein